MKRLTRLAVAAVVVAAVAAIAWIGWDFFRQSQQPPRGQRMVPARIADITPMVRLCTVDLYEEVPVRASIGKRHLFARQVLVGEVAFDIERVDTAVRGDTLVVVLPPEVVELREAVSPGAYTVIDTWSDAFFGKSDFTAAEENRIKAIVRDQAVDRVYRRGIVRRARREAVGRLASLLAPVWHGPVKVIDSNPAGTRPIGPSR